MSNLESIDSEFDAILANFLIQSFEAIDEGIMPVIKCSNGKYRIGSGKCIYKTKESAEKAQKAIKAQKGKK